MNVAAYVVSYENKSPDKATQLRIQQDKIRSFCEFNKFSLVKTFADAIKNESEPRQGLIDLMNKAPEGKFHALLVYSFDRIAFEEDLRTWIMQELKNHGVEVIVLTSDETLTLEQRAEIKSLTLNDKLKDLPSLPEVVVKVTKLVEDPMSSAAQLSKIISLDTGLTSRVLRLVNSSYYGFPGQISSIQHAIAILGFTSITSLIISSSIFSLFSSKLHSTSSLDYKHFWRHSLLCAIASKTVHQRLFYENDEHIFSAAILHDIGKIILDQYDRNNYLMSLMESSNPIDSEAVIAAEQKYCDVAHTFIGYYASSGWNLPAQLSDVIRYHHSPLESENYQKLTTSIYVGNILSHLVLSNESFKLDFFDSKIIFAIGISEDELLSLYSIIKKQADTIKDIESLFK